ncbi:hypothetical protein [Maribacter sp. R77961]|uniref:hypothetical protein n=1 Tax=Maribacter sp. R77961 TaxID=3093871 RepID=UPI0037C852A4
MKNSVIFLLCLVVSILIFSYRDLGRSYQVASGETEYWINSNGEYITSNNYNYDPNMDNSVNSQSWTKTTIQK